MNPFRRLSKGPAPWAMLTPRVVITIVAMCQVLPITIGAQAGPAVMPSSYYTQQQQLVPVDGQRRLNLLCIGSGAPTVLLDAGAGENMMVWRHVQKQIAAVTRTCSYDRAGYGFSDSATRPSDARNAVDDIHRLLKSAALSPIVYVGHSIAGLYGSLLTATYPNDVAGVVFLDPAFPHQSELTSASFSTAEKAQLSKMLVQILAELRNCVQLARRGALAKPVTKRALGCVDSKGYADNVDETLRRELERQNGLPRVLSAALSEYGSVWPAPGKAISIDDPQLDAADINFGDKPLVILTRGKSQPIPGISPAHVKSSDSAWTAGHIALAGKSARGTQRVVPNAAHHIQFDDPAAVIEAVRGVVQAIRGAKATSP